MLFFRVIQDAIPSNGGLSISHRVILPNPLHLTNALPECSRASTGATGASGQSNAHVAPQAPPVPPAPSDRAPQNGKDLKTNFPVVFPLSRVLS